MALASLEVYQVSPGQRIPLTIEERATKYLACCDPAVSGSRGHDVLFRVTCALVWGFALCPDVALRLLREVYNPRCLPPWTEGELRHKLVSACAARPGKPRGYQLGIGIAMPAPACPISYRLRGLRRSMILYTCRNSRRGFLTLLTANTLN
jgi:hypothetical protein